MTCCGLVLSHDFTRELAMPTSLPAPRPALAETGGKPLTGRKVAIIFCSFFAVVFSVNAVMLRAAVSTFGGVEVASAYRAGLDFPAEIVAADRQTALGWRVAGTVTREASGLGRIAVTAVDKAGAPIGGAAVEAVLQRPADRRLDRVAIVAETSAGRYAAAIEKLDPGQWELVLTLTAADGERFKSRNRLIVK